MFWIKADSTKLHYLCDAQHLEMETKDITHKHKVQEGFCSRRERESGCAQEIRPRDSRTESH